jgi:hypothetical protein
MQLALRRAVTAKVPRFFFHLYDDMVARDEEGQELRDEETARIRARVSVRGVASPRVATSGALKRCPLAEREGAKLL